MEDYNEVKIRKYDEVHNKIICDPGIAQEISDHFSFEVPGAKFMPTVQNRVWDGIIRLFNPLTCLLYCGLSSELEKFCNTRGYSVSYENIERDTEFSLVEANKFIDTLNIPEKFERRDYQVEAFTHAIRKRKVLMLSPTASGKSFIIYLITRYINSKTLIIVPTVALVHQMASDFISYGYDEPIHKIMEGCSKDSDKNVTYATWQSIHNMSKKWFSQFDVVFGDEAHTWTAKSFTKIMGNLTNCRYKFGFTGSLDGAKVNELVLQGMFGPIKQVATTSELIEQGHLSDINIKCIVLNYSDEVKKLASKLDFQHEKEYLVLNKRRNNFIKNLALSLEGNTIILYEYVDKHGKILYDLIRSEANVPVFFISGDIKGDERESIRQQISKLEKSITVASYGTSSTGINIPNLDNAIFGSPSKSRIRNLQSIGRILRKTKDKDSATLFDISDDLSWKKKRNTTLNHFTSRVKIYAQEKFKYKIYNVDLK